MARTSGSDRGQPAILVVAKAPRPGFAKTRLAPLLGDDGCARLQAALIARAGRWAVASGRAFVAFTPDDGRDEVAALLPDDVELFAQRDGHLGERLAHAFAHVCSLHDGPVLLVGTDQPTLAAHHVAAALDDLRDGVDVTFGPATDGGYYLLGARASHPALFAIDPAAWGGPTVFERSLRSVLEAGLGAGWLRSERDLDEPADARALLADPCAPADIVAALRGASQPAARP